jgi:hypothetical protein
MIDYKEPRKIGMPVDPSKKIIPRTKGKRDSAAHSTNLHYFWSTGIASCKKKRSADRNYCVPKTGLKSYW